MQIVDGKSRQTLLNEAAMQTRMIRNLERWLKLLTAFSGLGILLAWWGANNAPPEQSWPRRCWELFWQCSPCWPYSS